MRAMSVPGLRRTNRSALAAERVKRGSTTMSLAPLSWAWVIHLKLMGWFSAGLQPMIMMQSLLARSFQWLVMAPRPKVGPNEATVEECQRRAWCSR